MMFPAQWCVIRRVAGGEDIYMQKVTHTQSWEKVISAEKFLARVVESSRVLPSSSSSSSSGSLCYRLNIPMQNETVVVTGNENQLERNFPPFCEKISTA